MSEPISQLTLFEEPPAAKQEVLFDDTPAAPIDPWQEKAEQQFMFDRADAPFGWEREWQGMPEYVMGDLHPVQKIIVNFRDYADVIEFARLLNQRLTTRTVSIWFPEDEREDAPSDYLYVDEP